MNLVVNPVAHWVRPLALPFLNVSAMRFDTAIARTQMERPKSTLYNALAEVENTLPARVELVTQSDALGRARVATIDAEQLDEVR